MTALYTIEKAHSIAVQSINKRSKKGVGMHKNYIGIACTGHDASISIVNANGEILYAEAAERYLQNKRAILYSLLLIS